MRKNRPLRIAHIAAIDMTIAKFVAPLLMALQERGHTVDVIAATTTYRNELESYGLNVYDIPNVRGVRLSCLIQAFCQLYQLFKREKYDVVHTHTPIISFLARLAAALAGIPCIVYTIHGFHFHDGMPKMKQLPFRFLEWLSSHWTDYMFAVSEEDYRLIREKNGELLSGLFACIVWE